MLSKPTELNDKEEKMNTVAPRVEHALGVIKSKFGFKRIIY